MFFKFHPHHEAHQAEIINNSGYAELVILDYRMDGNRSSRKESYLYNGYSSSSSSSFFFCFCQRRPREVIFLKMVYGDGSH